METHPAIVWLGAVVVVLVAILIGVISARGYRWMGIREEWVQDLDALRSRLETTASETARLQAKIGHLDELAGLHAEVTRLQRENRRLQRERKALLDEITRIADLLGRH